ncbi:MAG: PEP-CTERM sorting domain-containing protein [Gammaproteobacteria bacterium]|nr:PEP-CTERM sorting domain-containing protein [Gammaproteobacteria bacterium]MBU2436023.1 PEP-CTERM sorting domain-containing protein [Gammaproteobacteria bacterium]MBU2449195.1 PEP-CTERM sorting domain-containing protein [Gammaproteobacteria bacterium]
MKFSLKTLAAAVVMAAAATGANAAIDNGVAGNGDLFFNIWDASGSYTRDLGYSINSFETALGANGNIDLSWAADATFASFLAGVSDVNALKWNIVAVDKQGANRLLETYTTLPSPLKTNDATRTAGNNTRDFATAVNGVIGAADSVKVDSASAAWAGKSSFNDTAAGYLGFSNAGTVANDSFANGLGFMRIGASATGFANSVYTPYVDGQNVKAYLDGSDLHLSAAVAAVPEPESYAMLLAGLGMIGFMARRNKRA